MITLDTPLPRGKFKGKTINELYNSELFHSSFSTWCNNEKYIVWMLMNWSDNFSQEIKSKFSWSIYETRTKFGSNGGVTLDSCWDNLS